MEAKFRTDKLQNGNCDTADNFVSPNTAVFKTQTSHTVRFKNTATPQAEILFTATLHEKMPNTATLQIPNVPLHKFDLPSFMEQWDNVCTKINTKCRGKKRTVVKKLQRQI